MLNNLRFGVFVGVRAVSKFVLKNTDIQNKMNTLKVMCLHNQIRMFCAPSVVAQQQNAEIDPLETIVQEICGDNAELEKKLRVLMLEVEVMRQDGRQAPDKLSTKHWTYLIDLETRAQRIKYLAFLFRNEKMRENEKIKKLEKKRIYEETPRADLEFPDDLRYGLVDNAMLLRIRDSSIDSFDNFKAHHAAMFGQKLVLDCSYEEHMVPREALNAAKQMTFVFGDNRIHREPFDIHVCNADMKGNTLKQLQCNIPTLHEPSFPLNIHSESYLDIFPKEKLVYLTPHCREELVEFDHDAIYIVGCMVDKINNEYLSLAKAKRDGLKMAKLPLDRYLEWAPGSGKSLNINHMIQILLDVRTTGDWEFALRHVPRRKLMESKLAAVRKNVERFNPKFIESLKNGNLKKRYKVPPRVFAGKINVKSIFNDDGKF